MISGFFIIFGFCFWIDGVENKGAGGGGGGGGGALTPFEFDGVENKFANKAAGRGGGEGGDGKTPLKMSIHFLTLTASIVLPSHVCFSAMTPSSVNLYSPQCMQKVS